MNEHAWGVVIASGRERGLDGALERMRLLVPASRIVAAVRSGRRPEPGDSLPAHIIEEPDSRGAALPTLVAALHALEADPLAVLIVASGPGAFSPARRGLATVEDACRQAGAGEDVLVLLRASRSPLLIARAEALLRLARQVAPDATPWFDTYRQVLRAVRHGRAEPGDLAVALSHLYSRLPRAGLALWPLTGSGAAARTAAMRGALGRAGRSLRSSGSSGLSLLH